MTEEVPLIQITLLDGHPRGAKKICFDWGPDIALIIIRPKDISRHKGLKELQQHNLYLLIDSSKKQVYVGETKGFAKRSQAHKSKIRAKLDWDKAIVLAKNSQQTTREFEKGHVQYFEYQAYRQLQEGQDGAYECVNKDPVKDTYIEPNMRGRLKNNFDRFIDLLEIMDVSPFGKSGKDTQSVKKLKKIVTNQDHEDEDEGPRAPLTFLGAAHQVLLDCQKPMHYQEISREAIKRELIKTAGKTPWATMNARLGTDVKNANSRFVKTGSGLFCLKSRSGNRNNKTRLHGKDLDTIVVPAQEAGFHDTFLRQNAWWAIRLSSSMLEQLKYIAVYRTSPVSAITHWAEIKGIEPYGNGGKYKLVFKGVAQRLEKPVGISTRKDAPQGPRYTNFQKLMRAEHVSEL